MSAERDREWIIAVLSARYANPQATDNAVDGAARAAMHEAAQAAQAGTLGQLRRDLERSLEP